MINYGKGLISGNKQDCIQPIKFLYHTFCGSSFSGLTDHVWLCHAEKNHVIQDHFEKKF